MADKTISELPRASTVTTTDLFVLEQAGQAKSLTGQVLINDLATALDGHGGIKSITLNDDYTLTFIMSDDTEVQTTSVRGATGAKGDKGTDGRAITSVAKISTSGLVDTYEISFSDNTSTNFPVTNGSSINSIAKTATSGLTDTYTVTLTDGTTSTFNVKNGNGIASITLQSGTHAAGTTDTYKITFDNGEFTTFSVYNGMNGSGSVVSVNGQSPDVNGNVSLTGENIPMSASDDTTIPGAIAAKQTATNDLVAEATLAEGDYFPFYDVSATANRKTPLSNIISKIRAAFASTPLAVNSGGTGATTAAAARENLGALSSAAGAVGTSNLGANVVTRAKMAADAFTLADNAGAHNAVYRGKNLGSAVTAAQWAAIQAGTFEDLFIGDYWTINGVNWRIAAFDYYYNTGDVLCTTHHVVIVPDSCLIHTAKWNNAGNTTGAYVSSTAYTTHVPAAQTTIAAAFGSDHILSHRKNFANATANGIQSAASWYDNSVALMTQANVYGNLPFGPASNGTNFPYNHSIDCIQYPLFAYAKEFICVGEAHWLRDVLTAKRVAMVGAGGECTGPNADNAFGIRPAFSIKA